MNVWVCERRGGAYFLLKLGGDNFLGGLKNLLANSFLVKDM